MRVAAQEPQRPSSIDPRAVAAFADLFLPQEMARRQIPGAVFVFVTGEEIAVARGYGAAQLVPHRPVDPDRTAFRLASVSKTITATAALQLVEQGRIDLDTDVNSFLRSFHIAASRGPITLHHLLTHTAGFDERLTGIAARTAADLQPSARYLAAAMPPTFVEPGRVISYSNHGYALVGQVVEDASSRTLADYARENIFGRLGMQGSGTLSEPLPPDLAVAYDYGAGGHRALSPDYLQTPAAGAFYTTGTDMGRFLIAHLRGGAYQGRRILRPETVALMHARHFSHTPQTSGWAYGLWEDMRDGTRALLHNGGGKGFRALIYLLPAQDAAFFLAYNLADRHVDGELLEVFITHFRQRFVPGRPQRPALGKQPSTASLAGDYVYVRRARTTAEQMISVVNRVRIATDSSGTLTMTGSSGGPVALTPIGPLLFRRADGRGVIAFDGDGTPDRLVAITDSGFPAVYERMPFFGTLRAQLVWLIGMAVLFLYASIWRPLAALVRRARGARCRSTQSAAWLAGVASALNLVFLIGFPLAFLGRIEGGTPEFVYGVPLLARCLLIVPPITAVLSIATTIAVVEMWHDAHASRSARLRYTAVALGLLAFVPFAFYWHLMGLEI
jgi:CubicO group peptidase (beta-lactamase class C family)